MYGINKNWRMTPDGGNVHRKIGSLVSVLCHRTSINSSFEPCKTPLTGDLPMSFDSLESRSLTRFCVNGYKPNERVSWTALPDGGITETVCGGRGLDLRIMKSKW